MQLADQNGPRTDLLGQRDAASVSRLFEEVPRSDAAGDHIAPVHHASQRLHVVRIELLPDN